MASAPVAVQRRRTADAAASNAITRKQALDDAAFANTKSALDQKRRPHHRDRHKGPRRHAGAKAWLLTGITRRLRTLKNVSQPKKGPCPQTSPPTAAVLKRKKIANPSHAQQSDETERRMSIN
jgi:hypothetical protein